MIRCVRFETDMIWTTVWTFSVCQKSNVARTPLIIWGWMTLWLCSQCRQIGSNLIFLCSHVTQICFYHDNVNKPHGIWSFQFRFVPLPYVELNAIKVRCFATVICCYLLSVIHVTCTSLDSALMGVTSKILHTQSYQDLWKVVSESTVTCKN